MFSSTDTERQLGGTKLARIVYDAASIARRVGELGREITDAYPDGELLVLGLLKGSFIFLSDLVRRIDTQGGVAPAGACDAAQAREARMRYTALYLFYAAPR